VTLEDEYLAWERELPADITTDPLWTCKAYRLATFASDRFWDDLTQLAADPRYRDLADQLMRSLGGIGAAYAEAYSRRSARDRCRYYEYSIGSAREARDWTFKGRRVIGDERASTQLRLLTRIIQPLSKTITNERPREVRRPRKKNPS
jgi:four helix bundle protein